MEIADPWDTSVIDNLEVLSSLTEGSRLWVSKTAKGWIRFSKDWSIIGVSWVLRRFGGQGREVTASHLRLFAQSLREYLEQRPKHRAWLRERIRIAAENVRALAKTYQGSGKLEKTSKDDFDAAASIFETLCAEPASETVVDEFPGTVTR